MDVYFAGELFSAKHIIGNAVLAAAIETVSEGRFSCILPQALEQRGTTPRAIRDQDLEAVYRSDVALFNFDGTEVDSGTVVEFMFAKFLDIPSVILRTDFRAAGDSGDLPWNLMLSYYPRTKVVLSDGLGKYQAEMKPGSRAKGTARDSVEAANSYLEKIAREVVEGFDEVISRKPRLPQILRKHVYEWARMLPGDSFEKAFSEMEAQLVLHSKVEQGLL
ncbi:MAG: nucleoside 2-deoxyribosyltransferase [Bdellovibrionales bacterium]|nr:nucleoside 2-deoxyribosyltransferase [Bdellovibrionales bacterium]